MLILFDDEEMQWIEKRLFSWRIKDGCPDNIRKRIEKKLSAAKSGEKPNQ